MEVAGSGLHWSILEIDYMFKEGGAPEIIRDLAYSNSLGQDMEARHGHIEESEAVGPNI